MICHFYIIPQFFIGYFHSIILELCQSYGTKWYSLRFFSCLARLETQAKITLVWNLVFSTNEIVSKWIAIDPQ